MSLNEEQLKVILDKIQNDPDSVTDEEELALLQEMNKGADKVKEFLQIVELTDNLKNPNQ